MAWTVDELIAAAGGDRLTINAFESAHQGDTPSSGTNCQGRVKGNTESDNTYWQGWASGQDATTKIVLKADTGQEPDGVTDASGDKALVDNGQFFLEGTEAIYIDIISLEFTSIVSFQSDGGGVANMAKCVHRDISGDGLTLTAIGSAYTLNVGGSLFKNVGTANYKEIIKTTDADGTLNTINCTIEGATGDAGKGFEQTAGTAVVKNSALTNNVTDISGTVSETTNKSEDDGDITNNDADDFTEPSTGDFTVYDTNSNLYHTGTAIADSWFTTLCATDLLGTSWNNPPSVGCYEYASAGGATPKGPLGLPLAGAFAGPI